MPKPTNHQDDDDPECNNSCSTNAALLPSGDNSRNNGYLWKNNNNNSLKRDEAQSSIDPAAVTSRSDLVLMELGNTLPRVDVTNASSVTGAVSRKGRPTSKSGSLCHYWREYRCQMIILVAFIEFGILVAGITFYFAGVFTATCDDGRGQGNCGECSKAWSMCTFYANAIVYVVVLFPLLFQLNRLLSSS